MAAIPARPSGATRSPRCTRRSRVASGGRRSSPSLAIASLVIAVNLIADSVEAVYASMRSTRHRRRPAPRRLRDRRSRASPTWSAASRARCCGACRSRSRQARPTAWSASRGAGSRPPPSRLCATCRRTGASPAATCTSTEPMSTSMSNRELRQLRATRASMVYQDPGSALNPVLKIGPQVIECFTLLGKSEVGGDRALARCIAAGPHRRPRHG